MEYKYELYRKENMNEPIAWADDIVGIRLALESQMFLDGKDEEDYEIVRRDEDE